MLREISNKIARFFAANNIIEPEDVEIYAYGMEVLIAECISTTAVLLIGAVFSTLINAVAFLTSFVFLRAYAGGFHANSHLGCLVTLVLNFGAVIVLADAIPFKILSTIFLFALLPTLLVLYFTAPVEHINKPLDAAEKKRNKILSCAIFAVDALICTALGCAGLHEVSIMIGFGMCSAVVSMAVAYITKIKEVMR